MMKKIMVVLALVAFGLSAHAAKPQHYVKIATVDAGQTHLDAGDTQKLRDCERIVTDNDKRLQCFVMVRDDARSKMYAAVKGFLQNLDPGIKNHIYFGKKYDYKKCADNNKCTDAKLPTWSGCSVNKRQDKLLQCLKEKLVEFSSKGMTGAAVETQETITANGKKLNLYLTSDLETAIKKINTAMYYDALWGSAVKGCSTWKAEKAPDNKTECKAVKPWGEDPYKIQWVPTKKITQDALVKYFEFEGDNISGGGAANAAADGSKSGVVGGDDSGATDGTGKKGASRWNADAIMKFCKLVPSKCSKDGDGDDLLDAMGYERTQYPLNPDGEKEGGIKTACPNWMKVDKNFIPDCGDFAPGNRDPELCKKSKNAPGTLCAECQTGKSTKSSGSGNLSALLAAAKGVSDTAAPLTRPVNNLEVRLAKDYISKIVNAIKMNYLKFPDYDNSKRKFISPKGLAARLDQVKKALGGTSCIPADIDSSKEIDGYLAQLNAVSAKESGNVRKDIPGTMIVDYVKDMIERVVAFKRVKEALEGAIAGIEKNLPEYKCLATADYRCEEMNNKKGQLAGLESNLFPDDAMFARHVSGIMDKQFQSVYSKYRNLNPRTLRQSLDSDGYYDEGKGMVGDLVAYFKKNTLDEFVNKQINAIKDACKNPSKIAKDLMQSESYMKEFVNNNPDAGWLYCREYAQNAAARVGEAMGKTALTMLYFIPGAQVFAIANRKKHNYDEGAYKAARGEVAACLASNCTDLADKIERMRKLGNPKSFLDEIKAAGRASWDFRIGAFRTVESFFKALSVKFSSDPEFARQLEGYSPGDLKRDLSELGNNAVKMAGPLLDVAFIALDAFVVTSAIKKIAKIAQASRLRKTMNMVRNYDTLSSAEKIALAKWFGGEEKLRRLLTFAKGGMADEMLVHEMLQVVPEAAYAGKVWGGDIKKAADSFTRTKVAHKQYFRRMAKTASEERLSDNELAAIYRASNVFDKVDALSPASVEKAIENLNKVLPKGRRIAGIDPKSPDAFLQMKNAVKSRLAEYPQLEIAAFSGGKQAVQDIKTVARVMARDPEIAKDYLTAAKLLHEDKNIKTILLTAAEKKNVVSNMKKMAKDMALPVGERKILSEMAEEIAKNSSRLSDDGWAAIRLIERTYAKAVKNGVRDAAGGLGGGIMRRFHAGWKNPAGKLKCCLQGKCK
ncbi:MAG: hypothetical protein A2583_07135 [Bdellovibrionales bacterium RIFOXYD1_FULL_53_11]|nr:MAG: hypothetical protein A2583_07135 [Bdellovibrionales bacterium RIFOXYD1_FULL_53_11]